MANARKKLSDGTIPAATTLAGDERIYGVQDGQTVFITPDQIAGAAAVTKAAILAALGIDQFDLTSSTLTIGLAGKIIILPLE